MVKQADFFQAHKTILWILIIGLIHGIVYVFLVPPWQHYDEPGNFEYAWLIASQDKLPEPGTYDQQMRRELAASMIEHNFYAEGSQYPNLISFSEPVWIGIPQLRDSVLYYQIISLPLQLISSSDITIQLYIGRITSLTLYLTTIIAAYGIACTLTKDKNPLRWMLPLTLALLPGFTDLMTAVNNDTGAVAFFSLFLWFSIRMIRYGFSWPDFMGIVITSLLCLFTKSTVVSALPLAIIPLLFGLLRGNHQKYAWGILATILILIFALSFSWSDAAHWQKITSQTLPTRAAHPEAPFGDHALQLYLSSEQAKPIISQSIHESLLDQIRKRKVSAGAWIWADGPANATISIYKDKDQNIASETIELTNQPQFYSFTAKIPQDTQNIQIVLSPRGQEGANPINVYYDGLIFVPGTHTDAPAPNCLDPHCQKIIWEGIIFGNLIRNSSAENAWPSFQPRIAKYLAQITPINNPSITLSSILNWQTNQWYFRATIENFLRTFWAKFGWGHVPLLGHKPYRVLTILTVIAIISTIIRMIRLRKKMPWPIITFLIATLSLVWGIALVRGLDSIKLFSNIYIPVARYAYPAIIPTAFILNLGCLEISDSGKRWFEIPGKYFYGIYIAFFLGLDILSIISIYNFYYVL